MALLARTLTQIAQRPAPAPAALTVVEKCVEARLAGTIVAALPEGALWIEIGRALVVADLHFEKGSAFAKGGQMLPPYDTRETLQRLARLIDQHAPDIVVSLGDAFHDGGGPARMGQAERDLLESLVRRCDWVWVEGNHDGRAAQTLGGVVKERLHLGPLLLRHEPGPAPAHGEIAGHFHPCARVVGKGASVRRRCFAYDGTRLVMPAFGAYAGGLNICDAAFAPIFPRGATALVLGKDRVSPAPPSRLRGD